MLKKTLSNVAPKITSLSQFAPQLGALLLVLTTFLSTVTPALANTQPWSGVCVGGLNNDVATIQGLECMIANIFTIIITLIGMAGFAMMIVASFRYLVSGGNTKGTETARNTFTYAVVGIVVALSSFIALNIIASFTGISILTQFRIPTSDTTY